MWNWEIKILKQYGCVVSVENGLLLYAPLHTDNTFDKEDLTEVTDPVSQDFLDEVNARYNTKFKMEDFGY